MLTITDFSQANKSKKTVIMCGRMHPGETHASWLMHGFIRFLLSSNHKAQEFRRRVVFKIVPILNPDGVIAGNYRTTFAGSDMNRTFGENVMPERLSPEATQMRKLIAS